MHANSVILYVADQGRARDFYAAVLEETPSLDVPGMTEFDLGGVTLGLMPFDDMAAMIPEMSASQGQRCELYLRRPDAAAWLHRIEFAGGRTLLPLGPRPWGETVGYALDPDGHVVAISEA
ncbi:MAG: VOC family protein [Schaalia hyovaginalis]|uniref:VOC family protein n=1 Tax=Schaalia hyovaginalis TaxID=29316 RepID=UPI0026ECC1D0|nr:VOC family protein [Schaalia hyovaginalis]MCI6556432.1 VOC family protein [Schaalia hyovaginalis]MDD7554482.1 VOC family protein [Schaalia hyovaginalis]MDY3094456.1 VOC family protein [Schaalia hyovaginalis]MDY6214807.1 VOC family protein [Schaalia hyovaginalis]